MIRKRASGVNTGDLTLAAVGAVPNANGASLVGQVLTLQPASGTQPGVITVGNQSFGTGAKTFGGKLMTTVANGSIGLQLLNENARLQWGTDPDTYLAGASSGDDLECGTDFRPVSDGTKTLGTAALRWSTIYGNALVLNGSLSGATSGAFSGALSASNLSGTNTGDLTLGVIGGTANANGASLSGQVLTLQPASASFGGIVTTGTQTFAGAKTFSNPGGSSQIRLLDSDTAKTWFVRNENDVFLMLNNAGTEVFRMSNTGSLAVGTSISASTKAVLQADSTTRGFLPPRMTTTQRDAITSVPAGLVIFNTTTTKLETYDGATWQAAW